MKKALFFSVFIFLVGFVPLTLAQSGFVPLAPIPGLTQGATADTAGLATFLNNLYKYLIGLSATLAVIVLIWEGIRIAYNQENVSAVTEAKGRVAQAIFGLVLVLAPALVFGIINPSILNLSLNLEPIKTVPGPAGSGPGTRGVNCGTPPKERICINGLTTGCKQEAAFAQPEPGSWCFRIVAISETYGPNRCIQELNYNCSVTEARCQNNLNNTAAGDRAANATCALAP